MSALQRGFQHDTEVLIRQVDGRLATLRMAPGPHDLRLAERLATVLRALVLATATASAADRARVRAAIHLFGLRGDVRRDVRGARRPARPLTEDLRVINSTARDLGRDDLLVAYDEQVADVA